MSFNSFGAKIKVVGVGGGGGNAVNTMIRSGLEGVDFIVANTDAQALKASLAPHKIQLGKELTKGLGAGADPDIGRDAALEDRMELQEFLSDADMVFITAGMGGGTGTGAAAVVAQIARELGALTVAVVTKPFAFEGKRRRKHGDLGVARLRECVDTLITIPNQRLLQVATPDLSMLDAFKLADNVLVNAVRGISDIINTPGLINVDFADVKTVMSSMGHALMGIGYGIGSERAIGAAKQAISSPLLEDVDIEGATGILINITAGTNVSIMEVNNACMVIQEAAHEDANIIFGAVIDETLGDEIRITVIATGFPVEESLQPEDVAVAPIHRQSVAPKQITTQTNHRLVAPPRLTVPVTSPQRERPVGTTAQAPSPAVVAHDVSKSRQVQAPSIATNQVITSQPEQKAAPLAKDGLMTSFASAPSNWNVSPAQSKPESDLNRPMMPSAGNPVASKPSTNLSSQVVETSAPTEVVQTRSFDVFETQSTGHSSKINTHSEQNQWGASAHEQVTDSGSIVSGDEFEWDHQEDVELTEPESDVANLSVLDTDQSSSFSGAATSSNNIDCFQLDVNPSQSTTAGMTVAEMVFGADPAQNPSNERIGAVKDTSSGPWDFDPHNPLLVSDEIDRRIDEALALAGQLVSPEDEQRISSEQANGFDMDDLDLPAFLRNNSDSKNI